MKRSMLTMLLVALMMLWVATGFSQTFEYGFSSTQGTYTPITGGLQLGTETTDDQRFTDPTIPEGSSTTTGPGIPIGFNFLFNGGTFDRLAVNANGWISLGQSALTPSVNISSSSSYTPIASTTAIDPAVLINRIVAMARDLQSQTGASIRVETIGTEPNRTCIVQWENYKKYGTSGTGDQLNFQIQLHETTNNVSIVYGNIVANTTNGNMQVGLRGPDAADFNARTGDGAWDNTTAATLNNQFVILNDVNYPANGLTFGFSYPVADAPPNPANIASPADGATLVSPFTALNWLSGGGLPDGYRISLGTDNPPTNIVNNLDVLAANSYSPNPELAISTTYYWQVVPYNTFGSAPNCPVWSFTTHGDATVHSLPYMQNWDAVTIPELPFDWSAIVQSTNTAALVATSTTTPNSTPNNVRLYNSSDTAATLMLISPEISQTIPINSVRVKAWLRSTSTTNTMDIGVMTNPTDPTTFELVQTVNFASTTYTEFSIPLSPYTGTGRFIAFKHGVNGSSRNLYIDDITFEEIAPNDLAATAISGNTTPSMGAVASYTVDVLNNGTAAQNAYSVKLMSGTGTELASIAGPSIAAGETIGVQIPWTPSTEGPISIYGKVVLAGDINSANDESPLMNLVVQPEGIMTVTIGDGSENQGIPWEFYYRNSLFQTLYYPTELNMFGNITAINFYNNFSSDLPNMPVKVWLGTTIAEDLSAGWVDPTSLTLVYDGTLNFPTGQNTITVPLQVPYSYTGGNLVLYANRPYDAQYYSSSDDFLAQTIGTSRARKLTNDSTTLDPMAPSSAGYLTGTFPKTTFIMTPLSPDPMFTVNPAELDFDMVILGQNAQQTFTIANAGGGTLGINSISITGDAAFTLTGLPALPAALITGQMAQFNVVFTPESAGDFTATISIVDDITRETHTIELSGEGFDATIYALPASENWDTATVPDFPLGWSTILNATTTNAYLRTSTTSPHSAPNCVHFTNSTDAAAEMILISPLIDDDIDITDIRVKLWIEGGTNYLMQVGTIQNVNDPTTFELAQELTVPNGWAEYTVNLSAHTGTGRYIAIRHGLGGTSRTIYVDDIEFELIAPNDLAALALTGNTTPSVNVATQYTVSVYNNGTATQSAYDVKLFDAANTELATAAGVSVAAGETVDVAMTWTPTVEGPGTLYAKVILPGDANESNNQTPDLNINVQPAGILSVTIGDGTESQGVPWEFFYKNSIFQCLYYPAEMTMLGNITAISFYNNFSSNLNNMPIKLWLGTTTAADLSAGWVEPTTLSLVYDGTMNFPSGANTITIPLQAPFSYTGGNLVLYANRPMDTQYYSSSDDFQAQTIGTTRARKLQSDSTVYDPMAPAAAGTLSGTFPKTTFYMTPMTGDPVFMVNPSSHDFGDVNIGGSRSQEFTITNAGGGSLGINEITIAGSGTMTLSELPTLPASLGTGETIDFTVTYTPNSLNEDAATVSITDDQATRYSIGNRSSLRSTNHNNREIHTVAISGEGVNDITIGDGSQTARVPMDFFYKNSLFETIYNANDMSNFVGMITGIKFYNNFSTELTAMPTKIWLGSTTQADLEAGWIPSTELTSVFDGTVDFPSGQNAIEITFPEPYMHLEGGNLVMMVNRPMDAQYYSSSNVFRTQSGTAGCSRNSYSDSTPYDPASPPDGSTTSVFPMTTFIVIPGGVGDISGTVLDAGNEPLADVAINVDGRPYSTTTDAQGQFFIANVLPGNYEVSFSRHGYVTQNIDIVLEEDETEVMNVTMNLMAQVAVTGTILASDTGSGIAGANISLVGYENYSGTSIANGTFSIPAVFANQDYQYSISAAGYTSTSGTIEVGGSEHNMGNITLSEVAYAPNSVVAELNDAFNAVNLSWNAPDPTAIEITESFEATTFPPDGWSQTITNEGPVNTVGVMPTWCNFGTITISGTGDVSPSDGSKQAGLWWDYTHQDEWLMTPAFNCPPDAHLSFDTYAQLGSTNDDHYYVKISTDGGNNWIELWDATAQPAGENHYNYPITVNLAPYAGIEVILAFHALDPPSNDGLWYTWFIDNIYIGNFVENISFAGSDLSPKSMANSAAHAGSGTTPDRISRAQNTRTQNNSLSHSQIRVPSRNHTRALEGYYVWRLATGQENNEASWISLSDEMITTLNHVDESWNTLPNGSYKWAVKAVYTADVISATAFSNPLVKEVLNGTIVGFVRRQNNQGIANATVSAEGGFTTTTNNAGAYSLVVPAGVYAVTATATGFDDFTYENITVSPNQNTTVNFIMTPTSNADEVIPVTATALKGNYPNPFNPSTTISYDIKDAANVRLDVYNIKGQLVRSLVNADQASGRYRIEFNGRDNNGSPLASGIYLYRLNTGTYSSTRKMMLME